MKGNGYQTKDMGMVDKYGQIKVLSKDNG